MQKRNEANKEVKMLLRTKLKRTVCVILCLVFAYSAIYAADISNKKMLYKEIEDSYALRVSIEKDNMLRLDLAGAKYYYDATSVKAYINMATDKAKSLILQLEAKYEDYMKSSRRGRDM